jgi:ATP-dependent Clp protease ATP-binding subunit ClpC
MQELQVSGEVADLLGSLDKGDLAASVDVLCDRVAQSGATVRPSAPAMQPTENPVAPLPLSTSDWHDGALDLTGLAESHSLDPLIGREAELAHMTRVLLRRRKRNPLLVGPAGVGKTALVEGLAQRIVSADVPPAMRSWRVIALSVPKLLAGTSYRGEFEERLEGILKRATAVDETHVLFIDEFDLVVTAGAAKGGVDAASILKPYMARGDLVVIGACTEGDRSETIMADPALRRRMAVIDIEELDPAATRAVLGGMRTLMQTHHGVTISDQTLDACVARAGERGVGHRPDNALEILDDACAHAVLTSGSTEQVGPPIEVRPAHVEAVTPGP